MNGEGPNRRLVLGICCLALLIAAMDNTVVNVALPTIQRSLKATSSGLQWVVDAYVLVLASLLLTSGSLGDRFGRRRLFQTGLLIFAAGSLACSLAPSLAALIAFRALQAVGGSMLTPSTLSIVANTFTDEADRARAIGIWSATSGVSVGIGPVLGGALVQAVGWRSVFWVNLPICAVAILAAARYVPESRADRPRRLDWPGQITATASLALLTYGLIDGPVSGWTTPRSLAVFAAAAVLAATFVAVEQRRADPLLELRFFRNPPFSASVAVAFVAFVALFAFIFFNTLYLQEVLGHNALMAGVLTLPATGLIVFAAPVSGRITAVRGPRLPTAASCALIAGGLALLVFAHPGSPLWHLIAGYLVFGLGIGLVNPPVTNGAVAGMPRQQAGVASATTSTARQVGGVFGVALIGSVVFSAFRSGMTAGGHHLPGGSSGGMAVSLTTLPPPVRSVADAAFTSAIHRGYLVAAGLAAVGVVVGALAMRTAPTEREPQTRAADRRQAVPIGR